MVQNKKKKELEEVKRTYIKTNSKKRLESKKEKEREGEPCNENNGHFTNERWHKQSQQEQQRRTKREKKKQEKIYANQ